MASQSPQHLKNGELIIIACTRIHVYSSPFLPAVKVTKRSTPFSNSNRGGSSNESIGRSGKLTNSPTDSHPVDVGLICIAVIAADLGRLRLRADMKSAEVLLPPAAKSDILLPLLLPLLLLQTLLAMLFLDGGGKLYIDLLTMLSLLNGGGRGCGMGDANSELGGNINAGIVTLYPAGSRGNKASQ